MSLTNDTGDAGKTTKPTETPTAAPASAAKTAAPEQRSEDDLRTILTDWQREQLAEGPVGRNTDCWNAVHNALPDLLRRLQA